MSPHDLRFTDTNSADDSQGRTWGLDGNLFWYLAGGAFVSVVLMLVLFSMYKFAFMNSVMLAGIPLVLSATYVFGFRQGRPPHYDLDCLECWFHGKGFDAEAHPQLQHPLRAPHV